MSKTIRFREQSAEGTAPPVRRSRSDASTALPDDAGQHAPRGSHDKSVRIGRTPVGKGVFARKRYLTTAVVGEILGDVIADPHYGSDYCMDIGNGCVLEPHAPFRFVNHSCEPNCEFDYFDLLPPDSSQTERRVFLIALREIRPGEELTIGYNWKASSAIPCRCGAATCCGWIVDRDQLAMIGGRKGEGDVTG